MKVVVCWSHISGYMAACWRALDAAAGVSAYLVAFESDAVAPFDTALLGGVGHRLLGTTERLDAALVRSVVLEQKPDVLMISGWSNVAYRPLAADPRLAGAAKLLCVDTPFRNDLRQRVGRPLLRSYLRRFDRIVVPGERAAAYAKFLGFTGGQIRRGLYGLDVAAFAPCSDTRRAGGPWPRSFLYVGRYAPEKSIDVLAKGYARYRATAEAAGDVPWDLICCGRGPEQEKLRGPGVTDLGFMPPDRQAAVFASAGAFVMPSRYEPWGVAIGEAAAAGLPLICSDACGAVPELLRDGYNGHLFATGDAAGLARAMARVAAAPDLPAWGERSRVLAGAFDAATWPGRVFDGLLPGV